MKKIFAEIGIGNDTFLSTELEEDENEYRLPKFILPKKITEYYFRFWIFKNVFIISTKNGFEIRKKEIKLKYCLALEEKMLRLNNITFL